MLVFIESLFDSRIFGKINSGVGFLLLGIFVFYFFSRERKDERGRKITAISSLIAFIVLFIILNLIPYVIDWSMDNSIRLINTIQIFYSIVLLSADIAILITRKMKLN